METTAITANRKPEHSFLLTAFWSLLVLILSTLGAAAETFTVTNSNDTGPGSLRQAVIDANFGNDTIIFDPTFFSTPRTITLAADRINIRGNTTINGPGANLLIVSGGDTFRIFDIESGRTVAISGMTLTEGNGQGFNFINTGGAILNLGNLTLTNMVVTGNQTGNGGGIYNDETGTLSVVDSTISNNVAFGFNSSGGGGGINNLGAATITGSVISGNTTVNEFDRPNNDGGGIRSELGSVTVIDSTITGNTTRRNGGGIWVNYNGSAGAPAPTLAITNSTISGNAANAESDFGQTGGNGGGIWFGSVNATIYNSTLSGNTAASHGGISFVGPGSLGIINSTIASNTADNSGGGFGTFGGPEPATLRNSIIADNSAAIAPDVQDSIVSQGFNLIENTDGAIITGNLIGNITGMDPNLGPLQDNGGPTETHSLLAGSPAIDQGESSGATTDQRGFIRPIDDPDVANAEGGDGSDMGAFESSSAPAAAPKVLLNIATRLRVDTGDNVLIGGFIVTGPTPKRVLIRAIGPSLGLPDSLGNPSLELFGPSGLITSNDDWMEAPNSGDIIGTTIPPTSPFESAILTTLEGNATGYTAIVRGADGGTGVGLVEIYDLDSSEESQLANIATRGLVLTGDNVMIGGFILGGETGSATIYVRALGPSIPVDGKLGDPTVELRDAQGTLVSSNDNWTESPQIVEIEGTTIPPVHPLEAALFESLAPGAYTVIVAGQNGGTGVGLVEVYRLK